MASSGEQRQRSNSRKQRQHSQTRGQRDLLGGRHEGDKQGRDNTLPGATDARQTKKKHHPSALPSYRR
eukprot:5784035-Pyramimonas_sp.AAC.1